MKLKKLLSVVISLTLLLSIISVPVFADGNNVAKIGGTEYASVTSAISAATSGATVTLIGDETLTSAVTLYTDIILDLNGHTLTMNVTSGMTGAFYLNGHSLTVRDTSAGQAGLIDITSSSGNGAYGFYVSGSGSNLLLESGNIVAKNAAAGTNWWNAKGIQAVTVSSGSTFTMTGGSLTASNVNNSGKAPYAVYVTGGTANITGGSVIIDDYDTYGWSEGHLVYKSSGTVNVTGGKFKSPKQLDFNELGSKLPAGYTLADADADGFRAVVAPVAQIGATKYTTLAAAIAAANAMESATITLLDDYDMESNEPGYGWTTLSHSARENCIVISGNVTLDLGGYTLSNLFNNTFKITGNVTVQNGEMRVGQYTNGASCSYVMMTGEGANLVINNLTTFGGINVSAATATINNLSFSGTTFYAVCSQDNAVVTINNGTYTKAVPGAANYLFWVEAGSVMNITGGTFVKGTAKFNNGKVYPVITGGTFDFNPTNSGVASGYEAVDNGNDTWTVKYSCDAKIGETEYATLEDAVEAANAGDTIVLLNDITYDADHSVAVWEKEFNLDLNGHTFTTNSGVGKSLSNMGYTATAICFAVEGEATVSNGTIRTAYGAGVYAAGVTATLSGLDIESNTVGVQSTSEYSSAVRLTSAATVIIESGSYKGENAIAVSNSGGDVIVNGGDFDGKIFFSTGTNSGVSKSITINGGNFTNVEFVNPNKGTLKIYGGTFSVEPDAAYIASGYEAVYNDNGTWTVGKVKAGNLTEADATTEGYDVTYIATKQIVDENNNVIKNDVPVTVNVKVVTDGENTAAATATKDDVKVNEIIGDVMADIEENAVISVELEFVRDQVAVDTVNNTITYDVHPEAIISVNGVANAPVVVSNDALEDNAVFKIKLPVPDALAGNEYIKVIHRSAGYDDDVQIYPVQEDNGNYFVQLDVTHFSEFVLAPNDLPLFSGYSVSLNGYIDLNFYLNLAADQVTNGTGTVVNFSWKKGEDSYQVQTTDFVSGRGYKATVRIPAAEMSYAITASVVINDNPAGSTNYSVRQYALAVLETTDDTELKNLLKTMLDYGAKAQVAFGRTGTDVVLANDGIEYTMSSVSESAINAAIYAANGRYASDMSSVSGDVGAEAYTPSLIYLSGCTLRQYFIGQELSGDFDGTKETTNPAYTAYYVEKTNIAAAELDTLQEFNVGDTTFYYSALDYVRAIICNYAESDPGYELAVATYWYNQAANVYFANH